MTNKMPPIETVDLDSVTGGNATGFRLPRLQVPWWLSRKPFKIPAADPPGHTVNDPKPVHNFKLD